MRGIYSMLKHDPKILLLFSIFIFISCNPRYGFIESEFRLSPDSRLPKWFHIPSGYLRKDLKMTITFYTHPFLKKVKMVVKGPEPEQKVLMEAIGDQRYHPETEDKPRDFYPRYIIISVRDMDEVFENQKEGPILHITDDPKLITGLRASQ